MRTKIFGFMVAITASLLLLGCPNPTTPEPDTVISLSAISGVTAPVTGATPVTTITETAQYSGTVTWSGSPATFAASTVYTATITLTPKAGSTLSGVSADYFTVDGSTSDTNAANSGVVTAVFPVTDSVITITAIPGFTAPVTGAPPVTTITETAQYTGTISWSPLVSSMFVSNTVYTATITLTPKAGFTVSGVAANSFTVAEATATNSINSGVVSAIFTTTTSNLAAVSDVTSSSQSTIVLKAVPGGTFNNGTTNMTVSSLHMSEHEITMEQFVAVTGLANPSSSFTDVVNGPVQKVNWYHAMVFCNKLSEADGLTPVYSINGTSNTTSWGAIPTTSKATWDGAVADWSANGYRLPTETEWQFAARGGNSTHNYTYAGSNTIDDVAWYTDNSSSTTYPVGGKAANELGLYDMSGNVWEWCWDWFAIYPSGTQTDYRGADSGSYRVNRGGSWDSNAYSSTVAGRGNGVPYALHYNVGFRVVRP
ncbi:MAG: SUMF1/EgtB/PvdO family nonheme iron enzyme [Spirochaetales bacterium]|nr:SUMF1/EgtB/PvdO family nonheme iron enzyme [Spirochaetales bacterium]